MRAIEVREADFEADHEAIRRIRYAVFVGEQRIPAHLELDERDLECLHVLAFVDGEPVGTGRLDTAQGGKIGRVAVLARVRRLGVGRAVMETLAGIAAARGLSRLWCHAQVEAAPFYERLGFHVVGDTFIEAGIPHVRMETELSRRPARG